jgi:hypothetical protein
MPEMKSNVRQAIGKLWQWFPRAAQKLGEQEPSSEFTAKLDSLVRRIHPDIAWEIGPGIHSEWQLVISPDLNRELLPLTRSVISDAPAVEDWEFHATRQPKQWEYQFDMKVEDDRSVAVDAREWSYLLLKYPHEEVEILLAGPNARSLGDSERKVAASILLQGILGEEPLLDPKLSFDLVDSFPDKFHGHEKPISRLAEAFGMIE